MTRLEAIKKAIMRFDFANFGLDLVEETKHDPALSTEWVDHLAREINKKISSAEIVEKIREAKQ